MSETFKVPRALAPVIRKVTRTGRWLNIYCAICEDNFNVGTIIDLEHHLRAEHGFEAGAPSDFVEIPVKPEVEEGEALLRQGPLLAVLGLEGGAGGEAPPERGPLLELVSGEALGEETGGTSGDGDGGARGLPQRRSLSALIGLEAPRIEGLSAIVEVLPERGPLPELASGEAPDQNMPDEVLIYLRRGLVVIPIMRGEKAPPLVEGWQNLPREELLKRLGPDDNVALRLDGLAVLDIERRELWHLFFNAPVEEIAKRTWVAETARGYHVYFRADNIKPIKADGLVELRTGAGQYCLAPPSLHPEGRRYRWLSDIEMIDIDRVGPAGVEKLRAEIEALRRHKALIMKLAGIWQEHHRHNLALWLAGALRKAGVPRGEAEVVIRAIALLAHDEEVADRVRAVADTYAKPLDQIKGFSGLQDELRELVGEARAGEIMELLPRPEAETGYEDEGRRRGAARLACPIEQDGVLYEPLEGGLILKVSGPTIAIGKSIDNFTVDPDVLKALVLPPQPAEVAPRELWDGVRNYIRRYVFLPDERLYDVLTAFVFWSYFWDQNDETPYLFVYGPYGSGKSRALEVLRLLCYRSIFSSILRAASLFRAIEKFYPVTLLIDEARIGDADVVDILRTGYRRGNVVFRAESTEGGIELRTFRTYCLKIFAHRDEPSEDVRQRSIIVRMMRALNGIERGLDEDEARRLRAGLYNLRLRHKIKVAGDEYRSICYNRRMEEIASPLVAMARAFNPEAEEPLVDYFKDLEQERIEEIRTSDEAAVLEALIRFRDKNPDRDYITLNELRGELGPSWEKRRPGLILKRLGFRLTRIGKARERAYLIYPKLLRELAVRYFIEGEASG